MSKLFVSLADDAKVTAESDGNFQVQNSNWRAPAVAGGTIPVKRGAWYYEVRCVDKCPLIGWAVAGFKKHLGSRNPGEAFYGDLTKELVGFRDRVRVRNGFNNGDIIGCLIDFDNSCIAFSHNGMFIPESLTGLNLSNPGGYIPVVELKSGSRLFISLSSFCTEISAPTLSYRDAGNAGSAGGAHSDALKKIFSAYISDPGSKKSDGDELQKLFTDVGSTSDLDPIVFVFMWYVNKTHYSWEIKQDDFVQAFSMCSSLSDIKRTLKDLQKKLNKHDSPEFKQFYTFVFKLLKGTSTKIHAETAVEVWRMLDFPKWKFFDRWVAFVTKRQQEREEELKRREEMKNSDEFSFRPPTTGRPEIPELIGLDIWESFSAFVECYPTSVDSFEDEMMGFNSLIEDFAETLMGK